MSFYVPKDVTVRCDIPGCAESLSDLTKLLLLVQMDRRGWTTDDDLHICPNHTNPANVPDIAA